MTTIKLEDVKTPADFAEYLRGQAAIMLANKGEVANLLLAMRADAPLSRGKATTTYETGRIVVPFDTDFKAECVALATEKAAEIEATVRAHIGEVWTATYKANAEGFVPPSEREDREEAVMILTGDGKGELVHRQFKIVRLADGSAELGDEIAQDGKIELRGTLADFVRGDHSATVH